MDSDTARVAARFVLRHGLPSPASDGRQPSPAGRLVAEPTSAEAGARRESQGQVGHLPVHGRRAEPHRDLRSQASAQRAPRPAAAGRVRRSQVPVRQAGRQAAGNQAHVQALWQGGHPGIGPAAPHGRLHRRHRGPALMPRRHGRALGRAVRTDDRAHRARLSVDGIVGCLRPRGGGRIAASIRGHAGSRWRAGSRAADVHERVPACRVPAHHLPARRPAGAQPRPAGRDQPGRAAQDRGPDPGPQPGIARPAQR